MGIQSSEQFVASCRFRTYKFGVPAVDLRTKVGVDAAGVLNVIRDICILFVEQTKCVRIPYSPVFDLSVVDERLARRCYLGYEFTSLYTSCGESLPLLFPFGMGLLETIHAPSDETRYD